MRARKLILIVSCLCAGVSARARAQSGDPPTRVGRLSDMLGDVSLYMVGAQDWTPASINYPLTTGDAVWADNSARAEVQLGPSVVRIAPRTSVVFGEVSDTVTQVRLDEGTIDVRLHYFDADQVYDAHVLNYADGYRCNAAAGRVGG